MGKEVDLNLDDDDIEFVVQQVWRSRCPISQKKFGGHMVLMLVRWNQDQPVSPYNLVLVMQQEGEKLMEHGNQIFPTEIQAKINQRLAWAQRVCEDSWQPTNEDSLLPLSMTTTKVHHPQFVSSSQRNLMVCGTNLLMAVALFGIAMLRQN